MTQKAYIGGELYFVQNEDHFAQILSEKLGPDAADLFREYKFDQDRCPGECERTYEIREDYERGISEALYLLKGIEVKEKSKDKMGEVTQIFKELLS